jgi:hydrogenase/urease accessory protein HupE
VIVTAALVATSPAALRAHDPGLSSLEIRLLGDRAVATLSLSPIDARWVEEKGGGLGSLDEAIDLAVDGQVLRRVDRPDTASDPDAGLTLRVAFERIAGARLTVRSSVPSRLPFGHRQLVTVRTTDRVLAERMGDAAHESFSVEVAHVDRPSVLRARALRFSRLGLAHILGGVDHLLFLAALLLGLRAFPDVVKAVTAFTASHSLTLALAALGVARVPGQIVEPLIALSIVYVGLENLLGRQFEARWKVTFVFGLVHGLGFAGALQELGLGRSAVDVATALGPFNAGVEAGQIAVVAIAWPLVRLMNDRPAIQARLAPLCSIAVLAAGVYWLGQRTLLSIQLTG